MNQTRIVSAATGANGSIAAITGCPWPNVVDTPALTLKLHMPSDGTSIPLTVDGARLLAGVLLELAGDAPASERERP